MTVSELLVKLDEKISLTAVAIIGGTSSDWVEYNKLVAKLRAYQEIVELAREPLIRPKTAEEE